MGRFTPAWASALLLAAVMLGLAFVEVPAHRPAARPVAVSMAAAAARPAAIPRQAARQAARQAGRPALRPTTRLVPHPAAHSSRQSGCPAGPIALTFDDGPTPRTTARLVRTLRSLKVPATFFMVGSRVEQHPELAQLVQRSGFSIANHTWNHPMLTRLTSPQIRHQLAATRATFVRHGIRVSRLVRPPFGDIDTRVRRVFAGAGMIPVLWTIDSRDWVGGGPSSIAQRILVALRPHRSNLVLQHDGVDNSPASVAAVPIVVRAARARGYCFTRLDWDGRVAGTR